MSERRLAAIAVLDVVGYSRMMAEDEEGTLAALRAHRNELDPIMLNHGGRIVKGTGDGLLLEVPSAVEAVKAALEGQALMAERNATLPEERRMQFRMGINLGDIIVEDDGDIYGDGVNVAARLEALADPGGICVSGSIHDQVTGRVDCMFRDLGTIEVKNVPRPIQAYQLIAKTTTPQPKTVPATSSVPGVAVFPFNNMSQDPEQDYFVDGITEDLITALSHYQDIRVSSRNAVFALASRGFDTRDAARELDVTYVVDGSVRKAGNRVRITSQLVEAENGDHIWADRYDRELTDIFELQDEIVYEIAGHIHPSLQRREAGKLRAASPEELDVWDLMMRARNESVTGTLEGNREALRLLEIAKEKDPTSVRVHIYLASVWNSVTFNKWSIDERDGWEELYRSSAEAYRLDPADPSAVGIFLMSENYRGNLESAELLSQRVLSLAPHDPFALTAAAQTYFFRGDPERAIELGSNAWRLGRYEPWRYHIAANLAFSHFATGNYEAAAAWARRGLEAAEYLQLRLAAAATVGQLGRIEEAAHQVERIRAAWPDATVGSVVRNVQWQRQEDIDRYREGLEKAGLPV